MSRGPSSIRRRAASVSLLTVLVGLLAAAIALAAHPTRNGEYAGRTSAPKIGGYPPPAGFTVSANGRHVLQFNYASFACFTTYSKGSDPWSTGTLVVVPSLPITASGHFTVSGSKDSITFGSAGHPEITTTTKITGRFTSAKVAAGTITFTRTYKTQHGKASLCGAGTVAFTVKFTKVL